MAATIVSDVAVAVRFPECDCLLNVLAVSGSGVYAGALLAIGVILGGHWKALRRGVDPRSHFK
jgi:hypothetical protein